MTFFELVMLSNEMSSKRVNTATEDRSSKEVDKGFKAPEVEDGSVAPHYHNPINDITTSDAFRPDPKRADTVKYEINEAIDDFHEGVVENTGLNKGG